VTYTPDELDALAGFRRESVSIEELMSRERDDSAGPDVDADMGASAVWAGRDIRTNVPWEPSLVRRGERPRVRRATVYRDVNPTGTLRRKNKLATGRAHLAVTLARYGGEPFMAPADSLAPCTVAADGPQSDLIGREPRFEFVPEHFERYSATIGGETTHYLRRDDSWTDYEPSDSNEWAERQQPDKSAPEDLPDTFVPMGANRELDRQADFYLRLDGRDGE
jgi:hypothetical protein